MTVEDISRMESGSVPCVDIPILVTLSSLCFALDDKQK